MTEHRQKSILLADDDVNLRRVLEFQLTEAGFKVSTARDGAEAFEMFTNDEFDCVITDLRMPKLSGLELLEKIKAADAEIPVIVITAFGEVETAVTAMKAGAFDYINKPFNRDEILLTLERAVNFSRTKSENRQLRRLVEKEFRLDNIIGDSPQMRAVLELVGRVVALGRDGFDYGRKRHGKRTRRQRHSFFRQAKGSAFYRDQLRGDSRKFDRGGTFRLQTRLVYGRQSRHERQI